jgi:hypothetical protein
MSHSHGRFGGGQTTPMTFRGGRPPPKSKMEMAETRSATPIWPAVGSASPTRLKKKNEKKKTFKVWPLGWSNPSLGQTGVVE